MFQEKRNKQLYISSKPKLDIANLGPETNRASINNNKLLSDPVSSLNGRGLRGANTPSNAMIESKMIFNAHNNPSKDSTSNLTIKKKIRMNSEEKLMAKKLEAATKAATYKYQTNRFSNMVSENQNTITSKNALKTSVSHIIKPAGNNSE